MNKLFYKVTHSKTKVLKEFQKHRLIYLIGLLISLIGVLITYYLAPFLSETILLFILTSMVTLSAFIGGTRSGIPSTIILSIGLYSFFPPGYQITYETVVFILCGYLISFTVEVYKKTDLDADYTKRENMLKEHILKLQTANEKALQEIKARDEFLSIATHELKNPLTSMLLQIQTAIYNIRHVSLANFSVESLMRMLDSAEQQTKQLAKMINDLLNVSLITTGKLDLEPTEVNLTETVKQSVSNFTEKFEQEGIKVNLYTNGAVVGHWDKLRIEQVMTNLLTNAIKYGDKKPIDIKVEKQDSVGKVIVSDQGIGIPDELQKKIFAKFERAVKGKEYQGLGVGLYVTNQIIQAHGGNISVESKLGKGSTFTVKLPIKK